MYGKIIIHCDLKVLTGMHIGATDAFSAIGAVDSPAVRDPMTQKPIVPGSSLKGKLRTMLARSICRDVKLPKFDDDNEVILRMFGSAKPVRRSRLQFSDCFVIGGDEFKEIALTEVKTGKRNQPRDVNSKSAPDRARGRGRQVRRAHSIRRDEPG